MAMMLTPLRQLNKLTPAERRRILLARISQQRGRIEFHHGSWRVVYWLRDLTTANGWRQVYERMDAGSEMEAIIGAAPIVARANERNQAGQVFGRVPTVQEFADSGWKKYLQRRDRSPSTLASYDSMMRTYVLLIGEKRINRITPNDISLVLESASGKATKTTVNLYAFLRVFFEVAQQSDLIARSPVRSKIHRPGSRRVEKPALSAIEAWKVLAEIPPSFRLIFLTDILTGYRSGELLGFRWLNFDAEAGTLQATHKLYNGRLVEGVKSARSGRRLKLARVLTVMLMDYRETSEWKAGEHFIFSRSDGKPYDPGYLRKKVLYPALKKAGIIKGERTHGFHLLRHTAATILADLNHDPMLVRDFLRHEKLSTTAGYVHIAAAEGASDMLADEIMGKGGRVN
jgi:integrase